jgi:hypothetical protein
MKREKRIKHGISFLKINLRMYPFYVLYTYEFYPDDDL